MTIDELIEEFSVALGTPLQMNEENGMLLEFSEGEQIAIDWNAAQSELLLGCEVATVPPGAGRERLFRAALIANSINERAGDFAYSRETDHLVLVRTLSVESLSGATLLSLAQTLVETSRNWRRSIQRGEVPHVVSLEREKGRS